MSQDAAPHPDLVTTRRLLWLYCILWLIEGAIRKWLLPQYSMVLLLVRDPVVLLIYFYAFRAHIFPVNGWVTCFGAISAVLALQSFFHLVTSGLPGIVVAFGWRTFALHLPLIWVVPAVFGRKEIVALGRWMLYLAPFLAVLMVVQFQVGPDHWLNAASIKDGAQIGSVSGRIRPPAIFSFITGPIHYFTLCTAFVLGGFLQPKLFPRWLLGAGVASILIAMSVSASRSLVLGCVMVAGFGVVASLLSGRNIGAIIGLGVLLVIVVAILSRFEILKAGRAAFDERWAYKEDAGGSGGKLIADRYGQGFISAFNWAGRVPTLGNGVGSTSNLAIATTRIVAPVEGEWERVIYEIGPITGFLYLVFRAALSLRLMALGFKALGSSNYLCLLFAAACFIDLLSGNLRQVTTNGYTVVCCGLCLAAFKAFSTESMPTETEPSVVRARPRMRGRGPLAVGGDPVQS